jgi:hypothetical protein
MVMLQHFRGNLDSWDPALVDRLAQDREVILLDNRGVGGSTGVVPEDVTAMARDALAFIDGLGLKQIDRAVVAVRDVSESREDGSSRSPRSGSSPSRQSHRSADVELVLWRLPRTRYAKESPDGGRRVDRRRA